MNPEHMAFNAYVLALHYKMTKLEVAYKLTAYFSMHIINTCHETMPFYKDTYAQKPRNI
jgi:hypothetical protein